MEKIIRYLEETYHPRALLVYGSFARGDNDEYSDFDCLIIVDAKSRNHDDTVLNGIRLDCFIYTAEETATENPDIFLPVYSAHIVTDDGTGKALQERVRKYVDSRRKMDVSEKEFIVSWYRKTISRMQKSDDEGNFRAISLFRESLEDYFLLRDLFFFGSKEASLYLKQNDPVGFDLFHEAVTERTDDSIRVWAEYVIAY